MVWRYHYKNLVDFSTFFLYNCYLFTFETFSSFFIISIIRIVSDTSHNPHSYTPARTILLHVFFFQVRGKSLAK